MVTVTVPRQGSEQMGTAVTSEPMAGSITVSVRVATRAEGLELVEGAFGGVALLLVGRGVELRWSPAAGTLRSAGLLLVALLRDRCLDPPSAQVGPDRAVRVGLVGQQPPRPHHRHDPERRRPMFVIEVRDGELLSAIEQAARERGVTSAAIVTLIGAVDSFTVSTMPATDATKDIITDYGQPAEMTATGEIVDGKPHIHAVMAVEGDRGITGHLHRAQIGTWFARAYVTPL
jgi:predicted DNA-binding protein with PD1-like motif